MQDRGPDGEPGLGFGFGQQPGGGRVPVARSFDRPHALPHEDPGPVQPFQQSRVDGMLGAHHVGVDLLELADDPFLVGRRQGVAVIDGVGLHGGAVEPQQLRR